MPAMLFYLMWTYGPSGPTKPTGMLTEHLTARTAQHAKGQKKKVRMHGTTRPPPLNRRMSRVKATLLAARAAAVFESEL